jgi:hypothetical protein
MMTPTGLDTCGDTSVSSHMHVSSIYHIYLMAAGLEKFSLYGNYLLNEINGKPYLVLAWPNQT